MGRPAGDVEVEPDAFVGWTYDDEFVSVDFDGDYVPEFGTTVVVQYDIGGSK